MQKSRKKFAKNLQVQKKGVPLQSLSETGMIQEPRGTPETLLKGAEEFIEKTERKKLPSPANGVSRGAWKVYKSKYRKTIRTRASIPWSPFLGRLIRELTNAKVQTKSYRNYTMKSLILAQDER